MSLRRKKNVLSVVNYLEHMLEAITQIEHYTTDMSEAVFLTYKMAQDAVIRNIEIIGEASKNISQYYPHVAEQCADIPWDDIYLMRNKITHDYHTIDFEMVWNVIQNDLPLLECQIKQLYSSHHSS